MTSSGAVKLREAIRRACPAFTGSFTALERYKVEYGGAGSGKSHAIARRLLYRFLNEGVFLQKNGEPQTRHTILVARKVNRTLKKSAFKLMKNLLRKWCRKRDLNLKLSDFSINSTELTITHLATDSQIVFCGVDDPEKIKSIEGITTIWAEEASELNQEDFEQLDLRLRGEHNCRKEFWLSFNPVSEHSWLKKVFFDKPIHSVRTHKTTYLDNIHIDDDYITVLENKKISNPRYYNIYALGNWGKAEGLIFSRVTHRFINAEEITGLECVQGLDFGYTNDPTAFHQSYIDFTNKKIYVYEGFYETGMSNELIAQEVKALKLHKHLTVADSSEPKSIDRLKYLGLRVDGAKKGADSINVGIDFLLEFEIIVNSKLIEFYTEFNNYCWFVDKNGKTTNKPVDDFNHFIDSLRYATEKYHGRLNNFFVG